MNEKPIIFNGEMVRAILDGSKTQTRRVITVPWRKGRRCIPYDPYWSIDETGLYGMDEYGDFHKQTSPYGQPGDRLWVKENWKPFSWDANGMAAPTYQADMSSGDPRLLYPNDEVSYERYNQWWIKISNELHDAGCDIDSDGRYRDASKHLKWRPGIFMQRSMSRVTLEVKSERVERLQDISEEDAMSEGDPYQGLIASENTHTEWFRQLWDSINAEPKPRYARNENGKRIISYYESFPWEDIREVMEHRGKPWHIIGNPWVWVGGFERVTINGEIAHIVDANKMGPENLNKHIERYE